jgi:hypothetical protein
MKKITAFAAAVFALASTPALADNMIRATEARVVELRAQYAKALRTRDEVTIASARAKLKAAQATAWAARNPAPVPTAAR